MRHSANSIAARRQETLGEYDLVNQITLYGPAYADHGVATATFIHERAHQLIGSLTTYGNFQRCLAMLWRAASEAGAAALVNSSDENLGWILHIAFDADEGFAMFRERELSQMLGIPFDEGTMPDDYAAALDAYDRMLSGYQFESRGMRLLIAQGIAEAIFNTDVLKTISPSDLLDPSFDCEKVIEAIQRPDERLSIMSDACARTDLLRRAERHLERMIVGRVAIGDEPATIDEAIVAAYEVPGVQADQQLKMALLAGSLAVSEALVDLGLTAFGTAESAIDPNSPGLMRLED